MAAFADLGIFRMGAGGENNGLERAETGLEWS